MSLLFVQFILCVSAPHIVRLLTAEWVVQVGHPRERVVGRVARAIDQRADRCRNPELSSGREKQPRVLLAVRQATRLAIQL